jgi:hypothetical protein
MQKLPIGLSDFKELRMGNYYFVDKSEFISEVINENNKVILITRPRRFGKTLNLSMLKYFFDINEDAKGIFQGLKIENLPEFKHQGKYPVIFLTFKDIKEPDFDKFFWSMSDVISDAYKTHKQALFKLNLDKVERQEIETIIAKQANYGLLQNSLKNLSKYLSEIYQVNPIVLLDEYDTPVHAGWLEGYYDKVIKFMRGLLSGVLKDNIYLEKSVLTGCLRISRESIFTGLNNLTVAGIMDEMFADKFGFTLEETGKLLKDYGMSERYEEVMEWYDGYQFGGIEILNPWSVLNYMARKKVKPYWANTSGNDLIKMLIKEGRPEVKKNISGLLEGEKITSCIIENISFPDLKKGEDKIYSLLLFSGYLKCEKHWLHDGEWLCEMVVPNMEVRYIYRHIIKDWLEEGYGNERIRQMCQALVREDMEEFEAILQDFVVTTLSYFDPDREEPEALYLGFIAGLLLNLAPEYRIKTNRESGFGRYDVMVKPEDRDKKAIIIELKSVQRTKHKNPEKAIKEAFMQIEKKGYERELKAEGYEDIIKMVIVTDKKEVWVRVGGKEEEDGGCTHFI